MLSRLVIKDRTRVVVGIYCFKMIFQLFFAVCRCFQDLKNYRRGNTSTSREPDFGGTENFASSPATLTDYESLLKKNEETCKRYKFASGWTKVRVLGEGGFGKEKDAKCYFKQLLDGVTYIHARGIVHRDLKPENLLVTKDKVVKISDFGLADFFIVNGKEIRLTEKVGTESYMAPEVIQSHWKRYQGPPVDLWACGIIFLKLMTKRKPWSRADLDDKEYKMWVENRKGLYKKDGWKELNKALRTLLKLLLEPNPTQRICGWRRVCRH
ncbi:serine/threonine-protein kinase grp-like [Oratosquilla oratoria]|uniref:serine/threonine-protein kinase grp-like n=1 Tax=Oratosquilla oratoria TaxID=337810 RepID=UPI003F76C87C